MGLVPEWYNKGERPMGSMGQYTQSNMFSNPTYEQQGKAGRLANALMQPQQSMQNMQPNMQPQMQTNMQPGAQPFMPNNANMMMNQNPNMQNWASQYQGQ